MSYLALTSKNQTPIPCAIALPSSSLTCLSLTSHLLATRTLITFYEACILICFAQFQIAENDWRSLTAQVSIIPIAPLQQVCVIVLKRYWPAVSQICILIFLPSMFIVLILKSIPMVVRWEVMKLFSQNLRSILVLPTPLSPIISSLARKSQPGSLFIWNNQIKYNQILKHKNTIHPFICFPYFKYIFNKFESSMSEQSDFSEDAPLTWIQWFCGLEDHAFLCEISEEYIKQPFNLYGLNKQIKSFEAAHQMILRPIAPQEYEIQDKKFLQLFQQATQLYGLIHARYITTPEGLAIMRQKFLSGKFDHCPRVLCEKQNTIPIGLSEQSKIARVKIYCPRCKDVFSPRKKFADMDGAFFGTSFPHLLLMTFPDILPEFKRVEYSPTVYGFKFEEQNQQTSSNEKTNEPINQQTVEKSEIDISKPKKKKKKRN